MILAPSHSVPVPPDGIEFEVLQAESRRRVHSSHAYGNDSGL